MEKWTNDNLTKQKTQNSKIKIGDAAQKRKRFLEQNGVSPIEARRLCLLPKDKLIRFLVEKPTRTDAPEYKPMKAQGISKATTSPQDQTFSNVMVSGKSRNVKSNMSLNYLPRGHKKSRWDTTAQNQSRQTNRSRQSPGNYSANETLLQRNSSLAESPVEKLPVDRSSRWDTPENVINENESVALMVQPVAILLRDFPRSKLTCSQMETIEEVIIDAVLLAGEVKPQFYGTTYEAGYLAMHCCNNVTSEWIKKVIPSLKPWPTAHMCATDEDKVPYPKVVVGQFLTSADLTTEVILDNIKHQNEHLNVDDWRVIARRNNNTAAILALSVDKTSAAKLEENKNRISFRLVQVILHFEDGNVYNAEHNI